MIQALPTKGKVTGAGFPEKRSWFENKLAYEPSHVALYYINIGRYI